MEAETMNRKQLAILADGMDLLKNINEATQDVFWAIDKNGYFIFVSPSVLQQRGYTPEEAMAEPAIKSICEEDQHQAQKLFSLGLEVIDKGLTRLKAGKVRLRQKHKNGSSIWTEVTSEFFFSENREFLFVIGVTKNIDAQVRNEQELAELKKQLLLVKKHD
jgi:PAS domain S-box-containing protein